MPSFIQEKQRLLWVVVLVLFTLCLFFTKVAKSEPIEMTFAHFVPPQHAQGGVIDEWAKEINNKSNGKLKINVSHSSQAGSPFELYDMMKMGIIDITYIPHGWAKGVFPLSSFIQLPFFGKTAEQGTILFWQVYEKFLQDEHKDVKVLWVFTNPPAQINTKKPVKTLEDMKGLKLGGISLIAKSIVSSLGAKTVDTSVNEMTKRGKLGIIDGIPLPFEVLPPFNAHKVFKFHCIVNLNYEPMLVAMNKAKFESLPDDMKMLINDNSGEHMAMKAGRAFDETEKMMKNICMKEGGTEYKLPVDELERWKAATHLVVDKWVSDMEAQGLPGAQLLEFAMGILPQIQ